MKIETSSAAALRAHVCYADASSVDCPRDGECRGRREERWRLLGIRIASNARKNWTGKLLGPSTRPEDARGCCSGVE